MRPHLCRALALLLVVACGEPGVNEARHAPPSPPAEPLAPPSPPAPAAVLLGPRAGATLRAAQQGGVDDFFEWFGWEERGREPAENGLTRVRFGMPGQEPPGDAQLEVVVDREDRIASMLLRLRRAFIDGPNAPRARDIAKSFVGAATPAGSARETDPLVAEIHWRPIPGFREVFAGDRPELPAQPSDGYLAFTGARPSHRAELTGAMLRIETVASEGGPWVEIELRGARTTAPRALGCIGPERLDATMTPVELHASLRECIRAERWDDAFFVDGLACVYAQYDARRVADPSARARVEELRRSVFAPLTFDQIDHFISRPGPDPRVCAAVERVGPPTYFPSYLAGDPTPDALRADFDPAVAWTEARQYIGCAADAP